MSTTTGYVRTVIVTVPTATPPGAPPELCLRAVGVVVPAHNEEEHVAACLRAIGCAAALLPPQVAVCVAVVLDSCSDATADIVGRVGQDWQDDPDRPCLHVVTTQRRNVGAARAAGCARLLECYRNLDDSEVWLASTDADSTVPPDWLVHQVDIHRTGHTVWVGTVSVDEANATLDVRRYADLYASWDGPTHPHVHGTNLGIRADSYKRVDGFRPVRTGEDHDLLSRLDPSVDQVARGIAAVVTTSARLYGRAPNGFAGYLRDLQNG